MTDAVVVDAVRTASGKGKPGGRLSGINPTDLLATVLDALVKRAGIDPERVDDVLVGCVTQAGEQSTNIARRAVLSSVLPDTVPAATIDRQCGSSQQAVHFAVQGVLSGAYDVVIAAGVESMSRVPIGAARAGKNLNGERFALRYPKGLVHQGVAAELLAARWNLDRADLDEFSARSHRLAAQAQRDGFFDREIVPVRVGGTDEQPDLHTVDETVRPDTTVGRLATLVPSFADPELTARFPEIDWCITPGNASPLTDGASAALITRGDLAERLGLDARVRFRALSVVGDDPLLMLTAPIRGTLRVLERAGLTIEDVDVYEVNEAFAPVPLVWARELGADPERLNPHGGAIALGHALGSSGTRLLATLVNHLESTGGRLGLQTMCEAGGMANSLIVERL